MTINGREYSEPEIRAMIKVMNDEIKRLDDENKDWEKNFANLNKISYGFYEELKEAKRLLKMAVEDFKEINSDMLTCKYCKWYNEEADECAYCPDDVPCEEICGWKHEGEALKLIGEDGENDDT